MSKFFLAITIATLFLSACAAPATPAEGPDATMEALRSSMMTQTAAPASATSDPSILPCSLGQDLAWRYTLIPAMPMIINSRTAFAVDGYSVAVNVEGLGPWRLEFGYPSQLGPFTGLCFISSGENVVLVEGAYYVPQPAGAQPVP